MLWRRFSPALPQHPRLGLKLGAETQGHALRALVPRFVGGSKKTSFGPDFRLPKADCARVPCPYAAEPKPERADPEAPFGSAALAGVGAECYVMPSASIPKLAQSMPCRVESPLRATASAAARPTAGQPVGIPKAAPRRGLQAGWEGPPCALWHGPRAAYQRPVPWLP